MLFQTYGSCLEPSVPAAPGHTPYHSMNSEPTHNAARTVLKPDTSSVSTSGVASSELWGGGMGWRNILNKYTKQDHRSVT